LAKMKILFITIIKLYKYLLSPFLPNNCRFVPTCSEYSMEAISRYGALKGTFLSVRRLLRCHPFHPGGFDPVR